MKLFFMVAYFVVIKTVYGDFNIVSQKPNGIIKEAIQEFRLEIDHDVNPPAFQANIFMYKNSTSSQLLYQVDANNNSNNITYANKALIFRIPENIQCDPETVYYITLDEGVLYSDSTSKSPAQTNSTFWHWKYIVDYTSSSVMISTSTIPSNHSSNNRTNTTQSLITLSISLIGESSPTRSAQLGMGIGITLVTIGIIIEIIYFKCCYRGHTRSGNYLA